MFSTFGTKDDIKSHTFVGRFRVRFAMRRPTKGGGLGFVVVNRRRRRRCRRHCRRRRRRNNDGGSGSTLCRGLAGPDTGGISRNLAPVSVWFLTWSVSCLILQPYAIVHRVGHSLSPNACIIE